MANGKELILHIGTGKTGSSSIQATFSSIPQFRGRFFYDMNGPNALEDIDAFIKRITSSLNETDKIVYSNEWLFRISEKTLTLVKNELSKYFENIKVCIYLRRQDLYAVSYYQQIGVSGDGPSTDGPKALPKVQGSWDCSYSSILERWENVFSRENIIIRVFEPEKLKGNDVVIDFSHTVGFGIDKEEVKRTNESSGKIATKIGHLLNLNGIDEKLIKKITYNAPKSAKMLPSRNEAIAFYNKYKEDNIELNKRHSNFSSKEDIFSSDFSMYELESNQDWDDETATIALDYLIKILKNGFKN